MNSTTSTGPRANILGMLAEDFAFSCEGRDPREWGRLDVAHELANNASEYEISRGSGGSPWLSIYKLAPDIKNNLGSLAESISSDTGLERIVAVLLGRATSDFRGHPDLDALVDTRRRIRTAAFEKLAWQRVVNGTYEAIQLPIAASSGTRFNRQIPDGISARLNKIASDIEVPTGSLAAVMLMAGLANQTSTHPEARRQFAAAVEEFLTLCAARSVVCNGALDFFGGSND
ncbi:MAG: hypothetical protein K8J08_09795 [Thermoanaerobaculia bacterium]|nr:hypothetical protein [Thermoanaerobaculia bacterium]